MRHFDLAWMCSMDVKEFFLCKILESPQSRTFFYSNVVLRSSSLIFPAYVNGHKK